MKHLFTIIILTLTTWAQAATWYVATNGNDNNPGTIVSPFKTLPAAIDAANPGDMIEMRGGKYVSNEIRINKSNLTIRSYGTETATIQAVTNVEDISACLWYNEPETSGGLLENLEIIGGYYYAVKFETNWDWDNAVPFAQRRGVSNVTIRNCNIHHSGRDGIKLTPACANISILHCEIHHTGAGPGALLDLNAEGIDNVNAPNLTVRGCHIHDIATSGLYVKGGGRNCIIEGNIVENCGEGGIYLGFYTDAEWFDTNFNPDYFENINGRVANNLIVNTQHAGIGLWGAKDAHVYNNTVINGGQAEHAALFFNITDVWIDNNKSARVGSQNVRIQNNIFVQAAHQNLAMVRVRENALTGNANVIDNNVYYDPNGAVFLEDNLDWQEWTLAQWKTGTAHDLHSAAVNPKLDATYHLLAGSPCINAGTNIPSVTHDLDGHRRTDGATDVGADEFGTTTAVRGPLETALSDVRLIGNPVADMLQIEIISNQNIAIPLQIVGVNGVAWVHRTIPLAFGTTLCTHDTRGLPAGCYVVKIGSISKIFVKM